MSQNIQNVNSVHPASLQYLSSQKHGQGMHSTASMSFPNPYWLVVSTHLKNLSKYGNLPQPGAKITKFGNHHLQQSIILLLRAPDIPEVIVDHHGRALHTPASLKVGLGVNFCCRGDVLYMSYESFKF